MQRQTAADFDQELLILFDAYVHGGIDRRGFLERAQKFAVGGVSASMLLASLSPNFAAAQVVPKDDKRIKTEMLGYTSAAGSGAMTGVMTAGGADAGRLKMVALVVGLLATAAVTVIVSRKASQKLREAGVQSAVA